MKHIIIAILSFTLLLVSCTDSDNPVGSNNADLTQEAVDFSLEVVNCFFTQDTTFFRKCLPDLVYVIDPTEPPYETSHFILSHYLSAYDYSGYTLEQYKETYDYEVWDYNRFVYEAQDWMDQLTYWQPTKDDYLFLGAETKSGKDPFMYYKPIVFFVTKSSGEWKIKAIQ